MRRQLKARFCLPLCALLCTANGAEHFASMTDKTGSIYSMLLGNWSSIQSILESHNGDPDVALGFAARYRISYDLDLSSSAAKQCDERQAQKYDQSGMVERYFCETTLAGNRWLMGDTPGWANENLKLRDWIYPTLHERSKQPDLKMHDLEVDFETFAKWPRVSVDATSQGKSASLPIVWKVPAPFARIKGVHRSPHVTISINGHPIEMILDTGSSMSLINASDVSALGIGKTVSQFEYGVAANNGISTISAGLAESVVLSGLTVRHVPIAISDTPFNILGLIDLSRFGAIEIQHDELKLLSPADAASITCDKPLSIASTPQALTFQLVMNVSVKGKPAIAFVDTGNSTYLTAVVAPGTAVIGEHKSEESHSLTGADHVDSYETSGEVVMGARKETITYPIQIDDVHRYLQAAIVGAGALKDVKIFVDFRRRRACFLGNN